MELLKVDTVAAAIGKLRQAAAGFLPQEEETELSRAHGRILAETVTAPFDVPGFDRSTVDGYGVRAADTGGAGESLPCFLTCLGAVEMGQAADYSMGPGQCVYVPTGGMLPPGADAVVMVEYCERFGNQVAVSDPVSPGRNLVWRGEDVKKGQVLLETGRVLRPADLGALAAVGRSRVKVWGRPRLAIFSSGDEVMPLSRPQLQPGQVYDINSYALAALAQQAGMRVTHTAILPDIEQELRQAFRQALADNDIVVVSGGSSQGVKDMTERIFDEIAAPGVLTHGLAVKPGKPTILAWDESSRTLLAGLPGHPVSALMVMDGVLLAWWRQISGQQPPRTLPARLGQNLAAAAGKQTWQPVRLRQQEDGQYLAEPIFYRSGLITALSRADGFFTLNRDSEGLAAGALVQVRLF